MATITSANTYFEAAQKRAETGARDDAIKFYTRAAEAYADVQNQYVDDPVTSRFINERIDECIKALKPKKRKISSGGNGGGGFGGRQSGGDDEEPQKEYIAMERPKERFADVAGLANVKEELVDALVNPYKLSERFKYYGVKAQRGVLLYGPPGCGKTYTVKAAAGETGAAFFYIKLSDVVSKWVGDTEKNLAQIFKTAEENAPAIIMFDEMDSIAGDRRSQSGAYKQFVSQLLQLLDGADKLKEGVFVTGGTNLPWEMDPAIIRTGRLDKCILVPPPDLEARVELFRIHCRSRRADESLDYQRLAQESHGFTSSDIAAICNEAAMSVAKEKTKALRPLTYEDVSAEMAKRDRPSASLKIWMGNVKRSPKAKNFPGLLEFIKEFEKGFGSDYTGNEDAPVDDEQTGDGVGQGG